MNALKDCWWVFNWSLLPEELLPVIATHLEDFDVVHARSVSSLWRSMFPFPASLLRPSYSLPIFAQFPIVSERLCTLKKIPLFLVRFKTPLVVDDVLTSEYFLGGICQDKSEDQWGLPFPIQGSIKVNIPRTEPTLINMHDCQILPLGHQYRMIGWEPWKSNYRGVAFIALNKERGEFVVLLNYFKILLVLRSAEMKWVRVNVTSDAPCKDLVAFRGRFYASFLNGDISVYDPSTLIGTLLMPSQPLSFRASRHLVRAGDHDELFLVEKFNRYPQSCACRVSFLDEEAGKWVVVNNLGDRVLFIGHYDNVACIAKELPDGCGVSGNSIVFTSMGHVTYAYKYGVDTGDNEDDLTFWRLSRENRVTSQVGTKGENQGMHLSPSPVLVLQVEHQEL